MNHRRSATDADTCDSVTIVAHDVAPVGGMEAQLTQLIQGLLTAGMAVTVVARRCEFPPHPSLTWVRVRGPRRPFALAYPWFFVLGTVLTWRHRSGLVHTTGAIVAVPADISTVHFCHRGGVDGISRARRRRLDYRLSGFLMQVMSKAAERLVYRPRLTRLLVAVSTGVAEELRRTALAPVEVIGNGVDLERFRPDEQRRAEARAELALDPDALVCLFVGSEWARKGLSFALAALVEAPGWRLLVVGGGDEPAYAREAERLGVRERVVFLGIRRDPERWYAASDALVAPTAYEAASLVVYEAAASGLPLVVCPVHGADELVQHGVTGWIVARESPAIATRLNALADAAVRRRLGESARVRAERFGWDAVVAAYLRLYECCSRPTDPATAPHGPVAPPVEVVR